MRAAGILFFAFLAQRCFAFDFYIAVNGSDVSGDGTEASPWATLPRAAAGVRTVNNQHQNSDINVYIRSGFYFLAETFSLGVADGSSNGLHVRYVAGWPGDEDASVTVHSGVQVQGWKPVPGMPGVWAASLPAGVSDSRQIYIGDDRVNLTVSAGGLAGSVTITDFGYTTTDPLSWAFSEYQDQASIEFLYTGVGSSWTECRLRVHNITRTSTGAAIVMAQPGFDLARGKFFGQAVSNPAAISNLISLLSAASPGAGAIDSTNRIVYYVPRASDNMTSARFMVPSLDTLIQVSGVMGEQPQRVMGLVFSGIRFAYAGWTEPNNGEGYVDMQSGFRVMLNSTSNDDTWVPVPGNLNFYAVGDFTITNCVFEHLGATAVFVDGGSQRVVVSESSFADVSCGGVYFGNVNDPNVTASEDDALYTVTGNTFTNIPVEYHDCAVICGGFLVNTTISQNTVINSSNTAVSLGWGWARDEATNSGNNSIIGNYIYGSNWLLEDGGSLYVLGPQPNSIMAYNYVSNQRKLFGSLYTDEGSAYWHIFENVLNDVPEWLHIWTSSIHDELVENCYTNQKYMINAGTRTIVRNITYVEVGQPFPSEAVAIINAAGAVFGPKP